LARASGRLLLTETAAGKGGEQTWTNWEEQTQVREVDVRADAEEKITEKLLVGIDLGREG